MTFLRFACIFIRSYKELRCPLDDFELLAFSSGTKGRSYSLCPYCYANPPLKGMPNMSECDTCMHLTCVNSMNMLGVSVCDECDRGILVMKATSAPKNWKLCCNSCDAIISRFNEASKGTANDVRQCDEYQAQMVTLVTAVTIISECHRIGEKTAHSTGIVLQGFLNTFETDVHQYNFPFTHSRFSLIGSAFETFGQTSTFNTPAGTRFTGFGTTSTAPTLSGAFAGFGTNTLGL